MKTTVAVLLFASLSFACKTNKTDDSVKHARQQNESKVDQGKVSEDVAEFLVKAADARMMGVMEGQLAIDKGRTEQIKNYGRLMVKDQTMLLGKIKAMAVKRNVSLPSTISAAKQEGYETLKSKTGTEFDKKFISMMKIDHRRDIKQFEDAATITDGAVKDFADDHLPMIQLHLEKLLVIEEGM